jgi:hypothetical protein
MARRIYFATMLFILTLSFPAVIWFFEVKAPVVGVPVSACSLRDTEIRANPTGYILARIDEGTPVTLVDTASPFVWVEYDDILGTVTESHIGKCD